MRHLSKLVFLLFSASCGLAGTWMASPGKGSHASAAAGAALRSMSSTTYASRTNTVITAPTGIQNGDILILAMIVAISGTPPTATLPAGFTTIQGPSVEGAAGFNANRILAWKLASSESGSYTVTHSAASSEGVMLCISGASSSTPVSSSAGGNGTTTTAATVTTPSDNSLVAFIAHNWVLYGSASPPSGTTPTFTEQLDSGTSIVYVATGVLATAGATGAKTQANGNGVSDAWGAFLVTVGP